MATSFLPICKAAALAAACFFLCGVAARAEGAKVIISGDPVKKTNTASTLGAAFPTVQTMGRTGAGPTERSAAGTARARPETLGLGARPSSTQGVAVAAGSMALTPGSPSSQTMSLPAPTGALAPSNAIDSHVAISGATARSVNASETLAPMNAESPLPK